MLNITELLAGFANMGTDMFGSSIVIGLFIIGIFAFLIVRSGAGFATDIFLLIIGSLFILLSYYGFLPNYFLLLTIIVIAIIFVFTFFKTLKR